MAHRHRAKPKNNDGNIRLEALKVTIEKKKKYNSRALEIVTKLSESTVVEDCLLKSLQDINQEHYQDIVEERAINKLCGYPLCGNLLKNVPTKQYHISTLHNKVFDITDRKNFCSNLCYKASTYLKDQILTSPLWLRDGTEPSTFKLFPVQLERGVAGVEVDFGITTIKADLDSTLNNENTDSGDVLDGNALPNTVKREAENSSCQIQNSKNSCPVRVPHNDHMCVTPILDGVSSGLFKSKQIDPIHQTEAKSNIASKNVETDNEPCSKCIIDINSPTGSADNIIHCHHKPCSNVNSNINLLASSKDIQTKQEELQDSVCDNLCIKQSKPNDNVIETQDFKAKSEVSIPTAVIKKSARRKSGKKNKLGQLPPMQNLVIKIEEVLKEWFTLDSLCFLFSERKVKELLADKSVISKEWQNMSGASAGDSNIYERYLAICRKLNILEMEDTKTDASFREETKKPLPDYDALKREAKELDLKVKTFYKGDKVVRFEETELNSSNSDNSSLHEPVLPLVDLHAQKALRRRIVLDKLKRTLQDLQGSLGIKGFNLSEDVRTLVSTFTLSAHNVTMKPAEWNLMAIVIIKLLSLRDKSLEQGLKNDCSTKHLALLLLSYSLDNGYLDRLICWITDIDLLIKKE